MVECGERFGRQRQPKVESGTNRRCLGGRISVRSYSVQSPIPAPSVLRPKGSACSPPAVCLEALDRQNPPVQFYREVSGCKNCVRPFSPFFIPSLFHKAGKGYPRRLSGMSGIMRGRIREAKGPQMIICLRRGSRRWPLPSRPCRDVRPTGRPRGYPLSRTTRRGVQSGGDRGRTAS